MERRAAARGVIAARVLIAAVALSTVAAGLSGFASAEAASSRVTTTGVRAAVPAPTRCTDVLVAGAAGGGESTYRNPLGATVATVAAAYARSTGGQRSVATVSLSQGTASVNVLRGAAPARWAAFRAVTVRRAQFYAGNLGAYVNRIMSGLVAQARRCPQQQLVLVGYGQGSMALHRALGRLVRYRPGIFHRLTAFVLVSDGDRRPYTRAVLIGAPTAPRFRQGIGSRYLGQRTDVPAAGWHFPVISVCTAGDVVCDLSRTPISRAVALGRSYAVPGNRLPASAAARAWAATDVWPLPPAGSVTVSTQAGAPLSRQLSARVAPQQLPQVRWTAPTGLPAGLTLSQTGLLSGRASEPGTYRVGYTLSNIRLRGATPSRGTLTVVVQAAPPPTATPPSQGARPVQAVAAGGMYSCQLAATSALSCWGANDFGQFGTGATNAGSTRPVASGSGWATVSAGGATTCGIRLDGSLWCWGVNHRGQVGDGTTTPRNSPVRVGTASDWTSVSVGWFTTCGVRAGGTAWCWGDNSAGELGDGTSTNRWVPTQVLGTGWSQLAAGGWHTCGVKRDGSLWCWGRNIFGQLGIGNLWKRITPQRVGTAYNWSQVAASWTGTCAVTTGGVARCWGRNDEGQVGNRVGAVAKSPVDVTGGHVFKQVVVGESSACGLDTAGRAWCWGNGDYGRLGDARNTHSSLPVLVGGGRTYGALSAGWMHECGISTTNASAPTGTVTCWGDNEDGQLGIGSTADSARYWPVAVPATPPQTLPTPTPTPSPSASPSATPTAAPTPTVVTNPSTTFTIGTANVLGDVHTLPGKGQDNYGPSRMRAEWTADEVRRLRIDILGTQEEQFGQIDALVKALRGQYSAWPADTMGGNAVQTTLLWRTADWVPITKQTLGIPFIAWTRYNPVVRLRNVHSGRDIWVMNVHNAPQARQAQRDQDRALEIKKIHELEAYGLPIFLTGDMNEIRTVYCDIVGHTSLVSPLGGSATPTSCSMPSTVHRIDFIFGSASVQMDHWTETRDALQSLASDHTLMSTRVLLP